MSEGMITQTRWKYLGLPSTEGRTGTYWPAGSTKLIEFPFGSITAPQVTTSYRSGSSFDKAIAAGATLQPDGQLSSRKLGDIGHDFSSASWKMFTTDMSPKLYKNGYSYNGPMFLSPMGQRIPNETQCTAASDFVLSGYGTKLIANASPMSDRMDIVQSVVEILKDGIPPILFASLMRPGSPGKIEFIRNLGSEYLGHMFATAPLVKDIAKLVDTILRMDTMIDQLIHDSGLLVRRQRSIPTQVIAEGTEFTAGDPAVRWGNYGILSLSNMMPQVNVTETSKITRDVWFSGAFTYYLEQLSPLLGSAMSRFDEGSDARRKAMRANLRDYLLGIDNTDIRTLWAVSPFSWLIDWFVNVGSVLTNRRNMLEDGLIMPYGYVMCKTNYTRTISWQTRESDARYFQSNESFTIKQRKAANPFGFGVSDQDMTPWQLSIIGALATQLVLPRSK